MFSNHPIHFHSSNSTSSYSKQQFNLGKMPTFPRIDDDDIGLPDADNDLMLMRHPNHNNGRHLDDDDEITGLSDDEEITGLEDRNDMGLGDSNASLNLNTPAPLTPMDGRQFTTAESQQIDVGAFAQELLFTLASKPEGYTIINELKADFSKDTEYIPDMVATQLGYPDFQTMIKSEFFAQWVDIRLVDGEPTFLPKDCSRFRHIREEMTTSAHASRINANVEEERKLARAMLPENREAALNGRKKITEIVYELGGQDKPVSWQDIQKSYREKYERELAGKELKDMFQRDKALAIIEQQFSMEIELFGASLPGHFFLQLKKPYQEILNFYEEQLQNYRLAMYTVQNSQEFRPTAPNGQRRKAAVYATGPLYPTSAISKQMQGTTGAIPSSSATNNTGHPALTDPPIPKPIQSGQQQQPNVVPKPGTWNSPPATAAPQNTANYKFGIAPEQLMCKRPEILPTDTQEETLESLLGEDEVPVYEVGQELQAQMNNIGIGQQQQGSNGIANNGQAAKKPKYTACFGDVTDSEEEQDDASTVVGDNTGRPLPTHGQQPQPTSITAAVPPAPGSAFRPISQQGQGEIQIRPMSHHQREIQNFMAQQMQKKGIPIKTTTATQQRPLQLVQQPNTPATASAALPQQHSISLSSSESATTFVCPAPASNKNPQSQPGQPQPSFFQPSSAGGAGGNSVPVQNSIFQNALGGGNFVPSTPNNNNYYSNPPSMFAPITNRAESRLSSMGIGTQVSVDSTTADWMLMEKANVLWTMATKFGLSHEQRLDELSFIFRKNNKKLIFSDIDNRVRSSTIHNGHIIERYYPKVDWEMFAQTICGIIYAVFNGDE